MFNIHGTIVIIKRRGTCRRARYRRLKQFNGDIEDKNYYYGLNTMDENYEAEYYIMKKGNEDKNFNKFDYKTWYKKNIDCEFILTYISYML